MESTGATSGAATQPQVRVLQQLYDDQIVALFRFVHRRCGADDALAEDICQEVFLGAARRVSDGGVAPGPGWLFETARSRLIDHWRRQSARERQFRLLRGGASVVAREFTDDFASGDRLASALATMPANYQAGLVLKYLDGHSTAEVAEIIGRTAKATESMLARARHALRDAYAEVSHG